MRPAGARGLRVQGERGRVAGGGGGGRGEAPAEGPHLAWPLRKCLGPVHEEAPWLLLACKNRVRPWAAAQALAA